MVIAIFIFDDKGRAGNHPVAIPLQVTTHNGFQIGMQHFQLTDVDRIRIQSTCCHVAQTPLSISSPEGHTGRGQISPRWRPIAQTCCFYRMGIGTNRHAIGMRDTRLITQGNPACSCLRGRARIHQRFITNRNAADVIATTVAIEPMATEPVAPERERSPTATALEALTGGATGVPEPVSPGKLLAP
uniref:Uncharacterized protein n=1 Tax=Panagrolaimus superbus TaxID=310955 RepID=A0A914Y1Y5_9BILA